MAVNISRKLDAAKIVRLKNLGSFLICVKKVGSENPEAISSKNVKVLRLFLYLIRRLKQT